MFTDDNLATPSFSRFIPCSGHVDFEKMKEFWVNKLLGSSSVPFPQKPSWQYQPRADFTFSAEILHIQSQKSVTVAIIIRAAWALVVAQYSETNDVVFGSIQTEQSPDVPGMENMMQPAMSPSPVRVQINREATIQDYLSQIRNDYSGTIPFEQAGLQNIRQFNDDCQNACSFQNILVVQTNGTTNYRRIDMDQLEE